jgi:hypothetical protein
MVAQSRIMDYSCTIDEILEKKKKKWKKSYLA